MLYNITKQSAILGGIIGFFSIGSLLLNITVLYVMFTGKFLKRNNLFSEIYVAAFCVIISDCLHLFPFAIYLTPTCILQVRTNQHSLPIILWRDRKYLQLISVLTKAKRNVFGNAINEFRFNLTFLQYCISSET